MLKRNAINKPHKKSCLRQISLRLKKGQSTVEYIVLVAAVLGVILVFLGPSGIFQSTFNSILGAGTTSMTNLSDRLANSYPN